MGNPLGRRNIKIILTSDIRTHPPRTPRGIAPLLHSGIPPVTLTIQHRPVLCQKCVTHDPVALGSVQRREVGALRAVMRILVIDTRPIVVRARCIIAASFARIRPIAWNVAIVVLQVYNHTSQELMPILDQDKVPTYSPPPKRRM